MTTETELSWATVVSAMVAEASLLAIAALEGGMDGIPLESSAPLLQGVRATRQQLADVERVLERVVAEAMPEKKAVVGSLSLERAWSPASTKWNHEPIALRVAAASRDERVISEHGEVEPEAEAAARVMLECAGVSYWRVGALRDRGIDPDEWRTKEGGRHTVKFS